MEHGIRTRTVHAGYDPRSAGGALAPPIHQTSTFVYESAQQAAERFARPDDRIYTRWGNPTNAVFERRLADLEGGERALATASGMGAMTTALLALLRSGDRVVASKNLYSGTQSFLRERAPALGIQVDFVDMADSPALDQHFDPPPRVAVAESPGNPTLEVVDLRRLVEVAQSCHALTIVDNTFATPINQRPLAMGVDIVIHSATKYLGGHGDLVGGAIVGSAELVERIWPTFIEVGAVQSPFQSFLIARGMQTLALRVAAINENAMRVAHFLESHHCVGSVRYPGLESHPQFQVARRQMDGCGGVVAFDVGSVEAGRAVLDAVQLCSHTVSLGDVKTLICHPASTTHVRVPPEQRRASGIGDGLIRLSVGIEDVNDIIDDLDQALSRV